MTVQEIWQAVSQGDLLLLDVRPQRAYVQGHVPQSVSAPYARAGWGPAVRRWLELQQVPAVAVFADNRILADAAVKALAAEGVAVRAVFDQGPEGWQAAGLPVVAVPDITVDELRRTLDTWTVIDVREPYEWRSGVVPDAVLIPLGQLPERLATLDPTRRYAVICATGNRSQSAAAFLADRGYQVANVLGGMSLWLGAGHPVQRPS
ncbi:MAG: rhodanese-like domain-containing protein [Actinomycetia bacterium]|nr:rhodanese-like domain-containing protein [Actinomycetes bacterium]